MVLPTTPSRTAPWRALEVGVNFFDSADIYGFGHNETLIGKFLQAGGLARRAQVVLATCAELGPTFVAYSPLGRAFLTGALDKASLASNDFRNILPRFTGAASDTSQAMVDGLGRFAAGKGMTNAQVALAWLLCKHPHVVPIPGTRRINYLEQNAAAAGFVLSPSDAAELDALFPPEAVKGGRYPEAGMVGIE